MAARTQLLSRNLLSALPNRCISPSPSLQSSRFYSMRIKNRSSIKEYNEIVKGGPIGTDKPDQKYFRITLMRSAIGLPAKTGEILESLGFRKRKDTVYHPVDAVVAGKIFAVKELIDVAEVDQALTKEELKELRRPEKGYYIESRAKDVLGSV